MRITTMIVIFSVRFLLPKGRAWEEVEGKVVSVLIVCHPLGRARQMGHEYCLDALCLNETPVSEDMQGDARWLK